MGNGNDTVSDSKNDDDDIEEVGAEVSEDDGAQAREDVAVRAPHQYRGAMVFRFYLAVGGILLLLGMGFYTRSV